MNMTIAQALAELAEGCEDRHQVQNKLEAAGYKMTYGEGGIACDCPVARWVADRVGKRVYVGLNSADFNSAPLFDGAPLPYWVRSFVVKTHLVEQKA